MQAVHARMFGVAAWCLGMALAAQAQQVVGHVKTVVAPASLVTGSAGRAAVVGGPVHLGDQVKTGPGGSIGITFVDETLLSLGPATEFVVEDYLFAPAQGDVKFGGRILRGTLQYVSGGIAKIKPEAVQVRTPSGTIGVRGTRFAVSVD